MPMPTMTQQNLRPLPMRITQKQYERLQQARANDQIAIQEHVRRALDNYLDLLDRKQARAAPIAEEAPEANKPKADGVSRLAGSGKLVYR
jgi:hypothetical protein